MNKQRYFPFYVKHGQILCETTPMHLQLSYQIFHFISCLQLRCTCRAPDHANFVHNEHMTLKSFLRRSFPHKIQPYNQCCILTPLKSLVSASDKFIIPVQSESLLLRQKIYICGTCSLHKKNFPKDVMLSLLP